MDPDGPPAADAPPLYDVPPAADSPPTADASGTSTRALPPVADVLSASIEAPSTAASQVSISAAAIPPIADAPPAVHGDLPAGAVAVSPAADHHPQLALGAGLPLLPLVNAIDQVDLGEPTLTPVRFGHRAHPAAPLFGEGSLNRPDSKGNVPERLERRYMSRDDTLNNKNQVLKALYGDLLELKFNYQAAMKAGNKKEAQYTRKNYENAFCKAEGLRRHISSNGAAPVPQPKGVTKDPS